MTKLLYITSSSYSGSTLLAFLLNTHPGIFTVSEMVGWHFNDNEDFRCSCGERIHDCPFFKTIAAAFQTHGIPYKPNDFGTAFKLSGNERFNSYLTKNFPFYTSSKIEKLRNSILGCLPKFSAKLAQQDRANLTFIRTALEYSGATVFADATKDPHRLRFLSQIPELEIYVLYLVRDIHGVVNSNMQKKNWSARDSARVWLSDQKTIARLAHEFPRVLPVYYEDLCQQTNDTLARIHRFIGLDPMPYPGNFKGSEHHILGNVMRMRDMSAIELDTKWQRTLTAAEIATIDEEAHAFLARYSNDLAAPIVHHYLGVDGIGTVAKPASS